MSESEKKVILIIDDITILTALENMLEKHFEICIAKSVAAAWGILHNTVIDLILLDFEMPDMTGLEFMGYLRENIPFYDVIPVIFVSGHGSKDVIVQAKKAGAKDFAVKPVTEDVLLEKIKAVFEAGDVKADREILLRLLYLLSIACNTGKNSQVKKLSEALGRIRYNVGADEKIQEILKCTGKLDYPPVMKKITELVKINFYDPLTG